MQVTSDTIQHVGSRLEDGTFVGIETPSSAKGISIISSGVEHRFEDITESIESIARAFKSRLQTVKPHRASIEFGIDIAAEGGKLFTVIASGETKANMKITLEWEKEDLGEETIASEAQETES